MERHGFEGKQGSVYFGCMERVNVTTVYMVVSELVETYGWFSDCVRRNRTDARGVCHIGR